MNEMVNKQVAISNGEKDISAGKMQIVHVVPTYLPAVRYGGPIFAVHGLCRALAARGHRVEVFTTSVDGPEDSDVRLEVPNRLEGVDVRYFRSRVLRRLFWSPSLARAISTEIGRFDVLHLHSVFLWPTWAAARVARNAHVPYVISPRGMLVKELIRKRSRWAKSTWIELIEKKNLRAASAIHVTSGVEADELRRFAWELPQIEVIPNGVDGTASFSTGEISSDVRELVAQRATILFLGRINWKKGLDRLLRAMARTDLKVAIVGPDDEGLLPQLAAMARDLGIGDRVYFLGRTVLGADKNALYASAQVFVLPSYSENFGNTILEAMQHGLPVITTPEVGAAQVVQQAGGGLVVESDTEPLSTAIRQLTGSASLARSMGEAGCRYVNLHFGWPEVAAQMEDLYARVSRADGHVAQKRPET